MNHKTDQLYCKKWGIFFHYLYACQNNPHHPAGMGCNETSWDECVDSLDTALLARQLADIGAGYLMFTIMQGTKYICAPNDAFNTISGYQQGEACSRRDLPQALYEALLPHDIDLYLYYTGDGPHKDPVAGPKFGFVEPRKNVTVAFVEKWAEVLREFSTRYGEKVKGWWIDGCYNYFGYDESRLRILANAARAGNANALVAMNNGVKERVMPYSDHEDYTCGEMNDFTDLPDARFMGEKQWHMLAPLGLSADGSGWNAWCRPGVKHSGEYMRNYINKVNKRGGVVTIDVLLRRDGSMDPEQLDVLRQIGAGLK